MFETHYNDEMAAEVHRLEARARAAAAGHPEWQNACAGCGCELTASADSSCHSCLLKNE